MDKKKRRKYQEKVANYTPLPSDFELQYFAVCDTILKKMCNTKQIICTSSLMVFFYYIKLTKFSFIGQVH